MMGLIDINDLNDKAMAEWVLGLKDNDLTKGSIAVELFDNNSVVMAINYLSKSVQLNPYRGVPGYQHVWDYTFYATETTWENSIGEIIKMLRDLMAEHDQEVYIGCSVSGTFTQDLDVYIKDEDSDDADIEAWAEEVLYYDEYEDWDEEE